MTIGDASPHPGRSRQTPYLRSNTSKSDPAATLVMGKSSRQAIFKRRIRSNDDTRHLQEHLGGPRGHENIVIRADRLRRRSAPPSGCRHSSGNAHAPTDTRPDVDPRTIVIRADAHLDLPTVE